MSHETIGAHVPPAMQLELSGHGRCAHCGATRRLGALVKLTDCRRPWRVRLVCRHSVSLDCFRRASRSAAEERLEPADPDARPTDIAEFALLARHRHHELRRARLNEPNAAGALRPHAQEVRP